MGLYSELGAIAAQSARDIATNIGEQITYQNRASTPVTLYAIPSCSGTTAANLLGGKSSETARDFYIPSGQTDTNGVVLLTQPDLNDSITYQSILYDVRKVSTDAVGAGWKVSAVARHVMKIGAT